MAHEIRQPEFEPASVPEQIVVLVALVDGLFDCVPISKVRDAEFVLRKVAADIPAVILQRLSSNNKLSDDDRKSIFKIVTKAIESFQSKPVSNAEKKS